ncbi:unnamed protein product [Lactuca virosa]|uniref:Uncharacterized protein n=1 Tax=Lactuca virosa TaxID=75947 RepID=A0AAU9MG15_9ASTR|nr:unnamed protein product [Lactuca virosa]
MDEENNMYDDMAEDEIENQAYSDEEQLENFFDDDRQNYSDVNEDEDNINAELSSESDVDKTFELEPTAICDNNLIKTNELSRHVISSAGNNVGLEPTPVTTKNKTKAKVMSSVGNTVSLETTPMNKKMQITYNRVHNTSNFCRQSCCI